MQLVERHCIGKSDPRFALIDRAAFASKNLYNAALYEIRQHFIFTGKYLSYNAMDKLMQKHEAYRALPAKVSQQVLKLLDKNWAAFFAARHSYQEDPSKFKGRPKLPGYKDKKEGRNILVYTTQAFSKPARKRGILKPSQLGIEIKTSQKPGSIDQVRIVPRSGFYVVEVVYQKQEQAASSNEQYVAGIDLGINNLAALAANKPGFVPVVVNGRPVKAINQFYNKRRAELQKQSGGRGRTRRINQLTTKRNRRMEHYMHAASKHLIAILLSEQIGTLIIGKNDGWKQEVEMGRRTNQTFCQIPHARFIEMLTYKAELVGITVKLTEESYTSQASFLDRDSLPTYDPHRKQDPKFSGKRVKRGLYRASNRRDINADINGACNIIRKVAPKAFDAEGVEDGEALLASLVVHPRRIVVLRPTQKEKSKASRAKARKR
ncbi:MAG TPA: transposase [Ktedonobacteraceae bacterium]|nr:transposase [Ktedonobacteraceae bacterium]